MEIDKLIETVYRFGKGGEKEWCNLKERCAVCNKLRRLGTYLFCENHHRQWANFKASLAVDDTSNLIQDSRNLEEYKRKLMLLRMEANG